MNLKNNLMAPRGKRRVGIFFLAIFTCSLLIMATPSSTNAQAYDTTVTSNGVTTQTFQSGDNTYFHSTINTSISAFGIPIATITSDYSWAVNTSTGVPAVGSGTYQQSIGGHTIDSGYNTNDQIQTDHQLMVDVNAGVTISDYTEGAGKLLYKGISYGYDNYYP